MPAIKHLISRTNGDSSTTSDNQSASVSHQGLILGLAIPIPLLILAAITFFFYRRKAARKYGPTLGLETTHNPFKGAAIRRLRKELGLKSHDAGAQKQAGPGRRAGARLSGDGRLVAERGGGTRLEAGEMRSPERVHVRAGGKLGRDSSPAAPPPYEVAAREEPHIP